MLRKTRSDRRPSKLRRLPQRTKRFLSNCRSLRRRRWTQQKLVKLKYTPDAKVKKQRQPDMLQREIQTLRDRKHCAATAATANNTPTASANQLYCSKHARLFTSPHVLKITERIRINGQNCPDDVFLSCFWRSAFCACN